MPRACGRHTTHRTPLLPSVAGSKLKTAFVTKGAKSLHFLVGCSFQYGCSRGFLLNILGLGGSLDTSGRGSTGMKVAPRVAGFGRIRGTRVKLGGAESTAVFPGDTAEELRAAPVAEAAEAFDTALAAAFKGAALIVLVWQQLRARARQTNNPHTHTSSASRGWHIDKCNDLAADCSITARKLYFALWGKSRNVLCVRT